MDQDNDGNPDNSDSDWKGGGTANPNNPTWNPNPTPGGATGSWGGGGGSGSEEGEDTYCPNDPEIDLVELFIKLAELFPAVYTLAAFVISPASGVAILALAAMEVTALALTTTRDEMSKNTFGGRSWTQMKVDAARYFLSKCGISQSDYSVKFSGIGCREVRENVGYYYPGFMVNTSRSPNTLMGDQYIHYYWHEKRDEHSQVYYMKMDQLVGEPIESKALTSSSGDCYWPDMTTDGGNMLFLGGGLS